MVVQRQLTGGLLDSDKFEHDVHRGTGSQLARESGASLDRIIAWDGSGSQRIMLYMVQRPRVPTNTHDVRVKSDVKPSSFLQSRSWQGQQLMLRRYDYPSGSTLSR